MNKFLEYVDQLPQDSEDASIAETARRLRDLNYAPVLLLETPGFLELTKPKLRAEIGKIIAMPDSAIHEVDNTIEFKSNHIRLLIYHYELLQHLRKDEPEAWDIINEEFVLD